MHKVVITAKVEDSAKWEEGFRTQGALFRKQTVRSTQFKTTDANEVVICFNVEDLDTYLEILDSEETAKAMAHDGVKRDTVKISVLDKEYTP